MNPPQKRYIISSYLDYYPEAAIYTFFAVLKCKNRDTVSYNYRNQKIKTVGM